MRIALPVGRRRHARQRLRDEHFLLEMLLASVDASIVACAADGRLTHASASASRLLGAECPLGVDAQVWLRSLRPRTLSGIPLVREDLPLVRALGGEALHGVDLRVCVRGRDLRLSVVANPVNDDNGRRRGAVMLLADVTERY
jgi:PAS domain-containing protein